MEDTVTSLSRAYSLVLREERHRAVTRTKEEQHDAAMAVKFNYTGSRGLVTASTAEQVEPEPVPCSYCVSLTTEARSRDHLIGGKPDAWKVPSSSDTDSLNKWASKNRFLIGDNLVWKYDSKKDSVMQVTREAYLTCNTTAPIAELKNDETKVVLENAGPHYFISGIKDNCDKGEKIIVVVISPRTKPSGAAVSPALAPSPAPESGIETPAVAPTSAAAAPGIKAGLMGVVGLLALFLFM
ncbi:hypothetical protein KSS87_010613 [Heliosperma pusillum]|nr:hypothetical protein KSS87_010613 [Heliosperma pusillum]